MIINPSMALCLLFKSLSIVHVTHSSAISVPSGSQNHASSNWWSRLIESYEDDSRRPANRRSHSATVYRYLPPGSRGGAMQEWMIVSGGFTDVDWTSFPVWAFDLSNARSIDEHPEDVLLNEADVTLDSDRDSGPATEGEAGGKHSPNTQRGPWIDLTGLGVGAESSSQEKLSGNAIGDNNNAIHDQFNASYSGPQGRVGHLSSIYNDCLYIFGGLIYSLGAFHVENDSEEDHSTDDGGSSAESSDNDSKTEKNTIIVWKSCGLHDLFTKEKVQHQQLADYDKNMGLLKWEKIIPRIDTSIFMPSGECEKDYRGVENDHVTHDASKDSSVKNILWSEAARTISRGEAQGGHYSINRDGTPSPGDSFILYGGIHRQSVTGHEDGPNAPSINNEVLLGDVWKYDYETETMSLLAPYPPLECQRDQTNSKSYPMARTSHSGTIIGDRLIIHGGMGRHAEERNNNNNDANQKPKTFSFSSSSSYETDKTSSKWVPLADTWEFDLKSLRWRERVQYPQLARSYHSLVGWTDRRLAAFGGFQQDNNIGGETVAFVFKAVIVSRANETHWLKLQSPFSEIPNWRKYRYKPRTGIPNRLEHTAVLDQFGSMYVWGGRFQSVNQISGVWRLDLFNSDANLQFELAQPDGIEQYEAELETLHLFIATMIFVSLSLSSFFSMMQQRQAREAAEEGNGTTTSTSPRRGGLTRQAIDSLPLKTYEVGEPPEDNTPTDRPRLEETECCPICLIEYEVGCDVRSLPCHHDFCRGCIDPWLESHTSCPACRQLVVSAPVNHSSSSSWAVAIGRMYSPNRRGYRYHHRQEQQLNDLMEADSSDISPQTDSRLSGTTDGWYNQGTTSTRLSISNPILRYFSGTGNTQPVILNDIVETIELV